MPNPGVVLAPLSVVRAGNAPAGLKVGVNIKHLHRGQLLVQLQAPDGSLYTLKAAAPADTGDDVTAVYTVNASAELATGSWKLRVQDTAAPTAGTVYGWSLLF